MIEHTRKFYFLFISLILTSIYGSSQAVIINGKADSYKGSEVILYYYEDYISFQPRQISTTLIDHQGSFKFNTEIPGTIKAFIRIENIASHIFLEPSKTYNITVPKFDSSKSKQEGSISWIPIQLLNQDTTEINNLIISFNKTYDKFLDSNYTLLITKQAGPKIQSFKKQLSIKYENISSSYFHEFMDYSIASLDQFTLSKQKLFSKYIKNKPISYKNPEYMAFISEFFTNHVLMLTHANSGSRFIDAINKKDYKTALAQLKKDTLLENEALCELILIKGLYENYYTETFEKKSIDGIFEKISSQSQFPEHRKMAENILLKTSKLSVGQKAPDFRLIDNKGKNINLNDFKGKFIYLNFWASWNITCMQDLKVMERLHEKHGDKIQFISISLDNSQLAMDDFLKKNPYNWTFVHFGNYKKIREEYNITNLPTYFLISPEGKFIQSPAETPTGFIEVAFNKITQAPEKKIKVGEK